MKKHEMTERARKKSDERKLKTKKAKRVAGKKKKVAQTAKAKRRYSRSYHG